MFPDVFGQYSVQVIRTYDNTKPSTLIDSVYNSIHNTIFISLDEGFDDSLYITVNDIPFLNESLKTNESIGYAGGFGIHFKDSCDIKRIRLKFVKANYFIDEILDLNYKSVRIFHYGQWTFYYTNLFPMRQ